MNLRMRPIAAARSLVLFLALLVAAPAVASPEEAFRKGMVASDLGRYPEAAAEFRRAITEDSQESERRVLISGVFYTAYLPHYHLGRVLALAGDEQCPAALEAWGKSAAQGVVRRLARPWADLQASRDRCLDAVLPAKLQAAEAAIDAASTTAGGLPPTLPGTDDAERRAALTQLDGARRGLAVARSSSDAAAADAAADLAQDARRRFEALAQRAEAGRADRLADARLGARRALSDLEFELRSLAARLADPQLDQARRVRPGDFDSLTVPSEVSAALEALERRLTAATTAEGMGEVATEAASLVAELQLTDARLSEALAAWRAASQASPLTTAPPRSDPPQPAPTQDPSPSAPGLDPQLQGLVDAAEALLTRVVGGDGELMDARRRQLTAEVARARKTPGDASHRPRLASTYAALQVVAGGDAIFSGRVVDAHEILTARALPGDAVGAQGLLLRAVALYSLAQLDEQQESVLLDRAARDLARYRALDLGGPEPGSRYFSPEFWRFFGESRDNPPTQAP